MEILATYGLALSYLATAEVCGVSHHTIRAQVKASDEGRGAPAPRRVGDRCIILGWIGSGSVEQSAFTDPSTPA
ncbi:hypothetical protein LVY72_22155 [Arthrobacter sp. I2-34]|uniref:Helix-turn-helix domain-containing protein n=1 Tax=Arthrobacter hankyongi TaxID=2904801 RepID=A0ABS9LDA1_9MICC|nr:hypothetical protein [Arthrobacter hankyongi]MCG2624598.1 hypothetical protein [Arthrobacter hankyongi]